jgi:ATP-binding cassette subfamily B protein
MILLMAIEELVWKLEDMFWRLAGIREYFEILDTPIEVQDSLKAKKLSRVKGDISFKNLSFSYDDKRKVLQNINIDIPAGEKIAFV